MHDPRAAAPVDPRSDPVDPGADGIDPGAGRIDARVDRIDPRGPRTTAAVTSVVLAAVLVVSDLSTAVATALLAAQAVVFALGSQGRSPYQVVFRTLVRPRLAPPIELEDTAPVRFAQVVGLGFATAGVVAFLAGAVGVAQVFTGFALVAALLNAAVGLCLGCEVYLLVRRLQHPTARPNKGATA